MSSASGRKSPAEQLPELRRNYSGATISLAFIILAASVAASISLWIAAATAVLLVLPVGIVWNRARARLQGAEQMVNRTMGRW